MKIKNVGVVGAGQMGRGIAQVFALKDFRVIMHDIDSECCEAGLLKIRSSLSKMLDRGNIDRNAYNSATNNIAITTNLNDLKDCQFIIEAVTEDIDVKITVFKKLDKITSLDTILSTNTSSIPISKISSATEKPDKVIGMHFMNPAPIMRGIEIICSKDTSDGTLAAVIELGESLGKVISISNDSPGFIANRILMLMINEAAFELKEGVADKENIDRCMTSCCNLPMGPLALADLIGLDVVQSIMNVLYVGLKKTKYKPCSLIDDLVAVGNLGRKSGEGFYKYKHT